MRVDVVPRLWPVPFVREDTGSVGSGPVVQRSELFQQLLSART